MTSIEAQEILKEIKEIKKEIHLNKVPQMYLTLPQAARYIGKSVSYVEHNFRSWIRKYKVIPRCEEGKKRKTWSFKITELDRMMDKKAVVQLCIVLLFALIPTRYAHAEAKINLNKIMMIESSGNPLAHNKKDDSRGLFQITPICLKEYNNFHKIKYSMDDLWNASISTKIAKWYIEKRIPQMLRYFKKPVTTKNIIIAYNAGINYVVKNLPLPRITKLYLKKYSRNN